MYIDYADITGRIAEQPLWWLDGVPRYCRFAPHEVGVYAREAALVVVEGQLPEAEFTIGLFSSSSLFRFGLRAALLAHGYVDVGDPPNYRDRSDPSATAHVVRVLEYWRRDGTAWRRDGDYEFSSDEWIQPGYLRLAVAEAGDAWQAAIERADARAIRAILSDLGCPDSDAVALLAIGESSLGRANRDINAAWDALGQP